MVRFFSQNFPMKPFLFLLDRFFFSLRKKHFPNRRLPSPRALGKHGAQGAEQTF